MKVGIAMHTTDRNIPPDELAIACEERGIESLLFPDHSHIPTSRRTQWPGSVTGEPLPEEFSRLIDPFVALGAAAAATTTLRLGMGMQRHAAAGQAVRTIACLPAVTGDYQRLGGGLCYSTNPLYGVNTWALTRPDLQPDGPTRRLAMTRLGHGLLDLDDPPTE